MSVAAARELAARAGVPLQYFANRSDKVGGSTLGNLAMAQVSMNCVDIACRSWRCTPATRPPAQRIPSHSSN